MVIVCLGMAAIYNIIKEEAIYTLVRKLTGGFGGSVVKKQVGGKITAKDLD